MRTHLNHKQTIALFRVGILGPLISARLEHGDRRAHFREAARRVYQHPDGHEVRVSMRTVESWYAAYRRGGFQALYPEGRGDRGKSRAIRPEVEALILRAKRKKPRRSLRRIIRILERARVVKRGELTRSSVHRLLKAHGISGQPRRGSDAERRSFLPEHASDLWVGDVMHGPRVTVAGHDKPRKSYLISLMDAATRCLLHSSFYLSEKAVDHERALWHAIQSWGLPRVYYVDRGAAYLSRSLRVICAELGVQLVHTRPRDAAAKGSIERYHRTWRDEVGDELGERVRSLDELNALHWAWLRREYHARVHSTTKRAPLEHMQAEAEHWRPVPEGTNLQALFLHRASRKVRKDGTVRFRGRMLEVPAELVGQTIELRFSPALEEPTIHVYVGDELRGEAVPQDLHANMSRTRQRDLADPEAAPEPAPDFDPLAQIEQEHYGSWSAYNGSEEAP